ncbi:MAG: MBOAT family protein [Actinobacteria bacterium]|nr:MBOAT family protein [Actinomycetota bacterium]
MLFPTVEFAVFLIVVLTASWLLMRHRTPWKLFMLAASYVFYAAWDWRYLGLIAGSTVVNQAVAVAMGRRDDERVRKQLLAVGVAANLGLLAWFKYYGFFVSSARNALGEFGITPPLPLLEIVLPVGISFFTFQAMSYVIDVYRRQVAVAPWLDTFLYLAFFPQLVAGPIVRGSEFLPQLREPRDPRAIPAARAFGLILGGLFKKVVIANVLATTLVDPVFATPSAHGSLETLLAIYGYAVVIYADFSGYTDIAIGVALLLGFDFPQNFDAPYSALSLRDFWRRWHMTLSRWLRDYLYIPLGGSSGGAVATAGALMATMVLGGLWHGAAWTFVIWGAFHGVGLAVERFTGQGPTDPTSMGAVERAVRRVITFHVVCLGWVLFRATSLTNAGEVLGQLFEPAALTLVTPAAVALILVGIAVQYVPKDVGVRIGRAFETPRPVLAGVLGGAGLLLIDALGPQGIAPFIYFQF